MAQQSRGKRIRIGLVQTKVGDDVDANFEKTAAFISKAASKGAEIVCLQELFAMRYIGRTEDNHLLNLAERIPGRISRFLEQQAKEHRITLVGGSLYEKKGDGKGYNTSLVFGKDGRMLAKYRKIHIPQDPYYYEQFYFQPGNLGFVQVKLPHITFAPLICYDQWYPEAARMNALAGAQLILYPTAIGWFREMKRLEPFSAKRWEDAICAHASMNGVYTAAVNRVGKEGELTFWGGSFIADPLGQVIARASIAREEVLMADIDLGKVSASQDGWGLLQNRRPNAYGKLVK